MEKLLKKIQQAKKIVLSTHRECDGDGLGAEIALFHALKKLGKNVRVLNVDDVAPKYSYLDFHSFLEVFTSPHLPLQNSDLALVFDTNDHRQLGPLYDELQAKCAEVIFIDHHPPLQDGPAPTAGSFINTRAASTGEIAYHIIKGLGIELDVVIAQALYTSVAFDTQVFRYIRNSPESHLIAAELVKFSIRPDEIHQRLFSTHTIEKVKFLSYALGRIEYHFDGRVALLKIHLQDLLDHGLSTEETRDVIDTIMNIESLQAAVLFREDSANTYKVSIRSKGGIDVLSVAEKLGGGGHRYASGAIYKGDYNSLRQITLDNLRLKIQKKYGSP